MTLETVLNDALNYFGDPQAVKTASVTLLTNAGVIILFCLAAASKRKVRDLYARRAARRDAEAAEPAREPWGELASEVHTALCSQRLSLLTNWKEGQAAVNTGVGLDSRLAVRLLADDGSYFLPTENPQIYVDGVEVGRELAPHELGGLVELSWRRFKSLLQRDKIFRHRTLSRRLRDGGRPRTEDDSVNLTENHSLSGTPVSFDEFVPEDTAAASDDPEQSAPPARNPGNNGGCHW